MSKLTQMKDLYQLGKQARAMQKELKRTEIEAENSLGTVRAIISADMKIKQIEIASEWLDQNKKRELEQELVKVISEGLSRAQAVSAEKAKGMMGDLGLNLPGM